jgi:hypothetical protein
VKPPQPATIFGTHTSPKDLSMPPEQGRTYGSPAALIASSSDAFGVHRGAGAVRCTTNKRRIGLLVILEQ